MKGAVVEKTWIGVLENTGLGKKGGAAGWVTKVSWDMRNVRFDDCKVSKTARRGLLKLLERISYAYFY